MTRNLHVVLGVLKGLYLENPQWCLDALLGTSFTVLGDQNHLEASPPVPPLLTHHRFFTSEIPLWGLAPWPRG